MMNKNLVNDLKNRTLSIMKRAMDAAAWWEAYGVMGEEDEILTAFENIVADCDSILERVEEDK